MAFTQPTTVVTNNISTLNPEPNDVGGLTAAQLQAKYDQFGVDFKAYFITHLAELASITAGSSASENLGSATIAGLAGNTIYAQIANMLALAQAAQAGTILPSTVTDTMLSNAAGQIKDKVTAHLADLVSHITATERTKWNNDSVTRLNDVRTLSMEGMV